VATLKQYISNWEKNYQNRLRRIPIFNPKTAKELNAKRRQHFSELFWHVRGHFADFLWVHGSRAPDRKSKLIVLDNIADEFGAREETHISHEVLYNRFAKALGANTAEYPVTNRHYYDFLRDYNKEHLKFLLNENWDKCSAAFSAYERLDNFDYGAVEELGKSWELDPYALQFFEVHRKGDHFGEVSKPLNKIWRKNPQDVKKGFKFIGDHQIKMWKELSYLTVEEIILPGQYLYRERI